MIKDLNPEEEILPAGEYHLVINYPLSRSYKESITFSNPVKRKEIAEIIVNAYNKIYKVEDKTSKRSISHIPGMLNRVHTDGDYGIWGHDLGDLYLHSIYVDENNVITCSVDS